MNAILAWLLLLRLARVMRNTIFDIDITIIYIQSVFFFIQKKKWTTKMNEWKFKKWNCHKIRTRVNENHYEIECALILFYIDEMLPICLSFWMLFFSLACICVGGVCKWYMCVCVYFTWIFHVLCGSNPCVGV